MAAVRSSGTLIERKLGAAMWAAGIRYRKQYRRVIGRPDFAIPGAKVAVFCDSSFWHGRGWPESAAAFKTNRSFWTKKIEANITRDLKVNRVLAESGWQVIRFWDTEILQSVGACVEKVQVRLRAVRKQKDDENRSN